MKRRDFLKYSTITTGAGVIAASLPWETTAQAATSEEPKKIRLAMFGLGNRGTGLMRMLLSFPDIEVVAVCDLFKAAADQAAKICVDAGKPAPTVYADDEKAWQKLLEKEKIDLAIIASGWPTHAEISLAALQKGIYVGCEVPIATSIEDCWKLVEATEKNKTPCMMLENWSFRQDNLAVLNMIRLGLFGEIMHAHCAYSHDCRDYFYYDGSGKERWQIQYFKKYNRNFYPTHALGPILSWLDINVGDRFTEIYSVATPAKGVNLRMKQRFGADHPGATMEFPQGDVVTSILKTALGKTVVLNLDVQLPRPYANRWMVQGTKGIYDEEKGSIYLEGVSPKAVEWELFAPYQEKYNHRFWTKEYVGGHGGTDGCELRQLVDAVAAGRPTPLDVYDSVTMSAVVELSGISIAENRPVEFPDFTKGAWKTRRPYFALDQGD
ncbi:MAG: Gfo/Idh/MocA family oxidoreductase [Planctomycetaceae bacterium]|nr:Gfo/Idh/MocA family oxidoreductase [Planctomycetaceae bacterium]